MKVTQKRVENVGKRFTTLMNIQHMLLATNMPLGQNQRGQDMVKLIEALTKRTATLLNKLVKLYAEQNPEQQPETKAE